MANPYLISGLMQGIGGGLQNYTQGQNYQAELARQQEQQTLENELKRMLAERQLLSEQNEQNRWKADYDWRTAAPQREFEMFTKTEDYKRQQPMPWENALDQAKNASITLGGEGGRSTLASLIASGRVASNPVTASANAANSFIGAEALTPQNIAQSIMPAQTVSEITKQQQMEQRQRERMSKALESVNSDISRALSAGGSVNAQQLLPGILDNARLSIQLLGGDVLSADEEMKLTEYVNRRMGTKFAETPTEVRNNLTGEQNKWYQTFKEAESKQDANEFNQLMRYRWSTYNVALENLSIANKRLALTAQTTGTKRADMLAKSRVALEKSKAEILAGEAGVAKMPDTVVDKNGDKVENHEKKIKQAAVAALKTQLPAIEAELQRIESATGGTDTNAKGYGSETTQESKSYLGRMVQKHKGKSADWIVRNIVAKHGHTSWDYDRTVAILRSAGAK